MTVEWVLLGGMFLCGAALGIVFYGGLWMTLSHLPDTRSPGLVSALSLLLRLGITLAGLYGLTGGHWPSLLAALSGFVLTGRFLVRRLGLGLEQATGMKR